jgi:hypothetical protein
MSVYNAYITLYNDTVVNTVRTSSKFNDQKRRTSVRPLPLAHHALGVAPPRAVRAHSVVRLGAIHQTVAARLFDAALKNLAEAVLDHAPVRAQLLDEHVAPGGNVGVEVLVFARDGAEVRADAQVGARDPAVLRAVLARVVLDQTRGSAHGVRAPRAHGAAKIMDARVLGPESPDLRVRIGGSSSSSRGHLGWGEPEGRLFVGVLRKRCRTEIVPLDQLHKNVIQGVYNVIAY